jgi:hypothetical protein
LLWASPGKSTLEQIEHLCVSLIQNYRNILGAPTFLTDPRVLD